MDSEYFITQVFPLYRVRFISISDNFDSIDYKNDTGGIDIAFKFLMHEYYSADLSKKVKSAKRIQMARGENIVAGAIYGYRKNENGKWEADTEAAEVVRLMCQMALAGMPPALIRDKLHEAGYPTPREYIEMKRGKDITPTCLWEARAVTRMLTNEQYIGSYVSGKQESKAVGSHSKNWTDKSAWIVIPNRHPPLVSKEDFAKVQEIMKAYLTSERTPKTAKHCHNENHIPRTVERNRRVMPYGFSFGKDGNWCMDETAAAVVRRIFGLALQDVCESEIAEMLKMDKIPAPQAYRKIKRGGNVAPTYAWRTKGVRDILRDIQYTGACVSGKHQKKGGGRNGYYRTHESDWIIEPDKIPAIVSKSDFDKVAELMANRGKRVLKPRDYLLRGKVRCGCCGFALCYDALNAPVFRCYHTTANPNADCHKMKVSVRELDDVVLEIIKKQAEIVLNSGNLSKLRHKDTDTQRIADCDKQIRACVEERQRHYEQFITREIDHEMYQSLKTDCAAQMDKLNDQLAVLKQAERDKQVNKKSVALAKEVLKASATPREIVDALIETIRVFPGNRIEIRWKISDFTNMNMAGKRNVE
jgi:hypothetical protein